MDNTCRRRRQLGANELKSRINTHRRYSGRRFGASRAGALLFARNRKGNVVSILGPAVPVWQRVDVLCYAASTLIACLVLAVLWTTL